MAAGSAGFTLTVDGSSFTASSVVNWSGAARPTTYVSAGQLMAAISAADVSAAGTAQVTVSTPAPGGGTSSAVPFTVSSVPHGQTVGIVAMLGVNQSGQPGNGATFAPAMSTDGRYVAFSSMASNLVDDDTNSAADVFVQDTCHGTSAPTGCKPSIQRASLDFSGKQLPNGVVANYPIAPLNAISGDGRFVVFLAQVGDLMPSPGVPTYTQELFLRDTCIGQPASCVPSTTLVSQDGAGNPSNGIASNPSISRDGRVVAFISGATNLVSGPVPAGQFYLRDTCFGAGPGCTPSTHLISAAADGTPANGEVRTGTISGGGRYAVFQSHASNLVSGDANGREDIFVRDTCVGAPAGCTPATLLASPPRAGSASQSNVFAEFASVSADGRFVLFESSATNLVATDTQGPQTFIRDTCLGATSPCTPGTSLLSAALDGTPADSDSAVNGTSLLSADGRYAVFASDADNLLPAVGPLSCYVKDTCAGASAGCTPQLKVVSIDSHGNLLRDCSNGLLGFGVPAISADGHLGVLEHFDQATNTTQAYLILTGF
jgi:Tol biopolymer transport system component